MHTGRKIGELAAATGLTVRTLHHYEDIGLLVASGRSAAGHRVYSDDDLRRLYRICLLRRIGLPLAEIGRALDDPAWDLRGSVAAHLGDLERRLADEQRLRGRLARLMATIETGDASISDDLLTVLEDMTMLDTNVQRRISILVYADLPAAHDHLTEVFGLGPGKLTRSPDGKVVHGEIQAGDGVVWLHPESSDYALASPRALGAATGCTAVLVDDVDAHHERARRRGAHVVYEPVDQPYGYREYAARDPEGHLWSFMKSLD